MTFLLSVKISNPAKPSELPKLSNPNKSFAMEEINNTLSFLFVEIKINQNEFDTWKVTSTGLLISFSAKMWKKGAIHVFIAQRTNNMLCKKKYFKLEVCKWRQFFYSKYPVLFFNPILDRFLNKRTNSTIMEEEKNPKAFLRIPYLGKRSKSFLKNIEKILKLKFDVKLYSIYTTTIVGHYFQFKIRSFFFALRSDVVYKFTCSRDANLTYILTSSRHLSIRAWTFWN